MISVNGTCSVYIDFVKLKMLSLTLYVNHLDFSKLWSFFSTIISQNKSDDCFINNMRNHRILAE